METGQKEKSLFPLFPTDTNRVRKSRDSNNNGRREGLDVSCDQMLVKRLKQLPRSHTVKFSLKNLRNNLA